MIPKPASGSSPPIDDRDNRLETGKATDHENRQPSNGIQQWHIGTETEWMTCIRGAFLHAHDRSHGNRLNDSDQREESIQQNGIGASQCRKGKRQDHHDHVHDQGKKDQAMRALIDHELGKLICIRFNSRQTISQRIDGRRAYP